MSAQTFGRRSRDMTVGKQHKSREGGKRQSDRTRVGREDPTIKGSITWADLATDTKLRLALGLVPPNVASEPDTSKKTSRQSFFKIQSAIDAELAAGGRIIGLRPGERYRRIVERMILMGYKKSEIPHIRTVREFFNRGPGKAENNG
jgi:hypothetical protein